MPANQPVPIVRPSSMPSPTPAQLAESPKPTFLKLSTPPSSPKPEMKPESESESSGKSEDEKSEEEDEVVPYAPPQKVELGSAVDELLDELMNDMGDSSSAEEQAKEPPKAAKEAKAAKGAKEAKEAKEKGVEEQKDELELKAFDIELEKVHRKEEPEPEEDPKTESTTPSITPRAKAFTSSSGLSRSSSWNMVKRREDGSEPRASMFRARQVLTSPRDSVFNMPPIPTPGERPAPPPLPIFNTAELASVLAATEVPETTKPETGGKDDTNAEELSEKSHTPREDNDSSSNLLGSSSSTLLHSKNEEITDDADAEQESPNDAGTKFSL